MAAIAFVAAPAIRGYFGPQDGDAATARIDPVAGALNLRAPGSGNPISATIYFEANGETKLEHLCTYMRLVPTRTQLSKAWLDNKFRRLVADLDIKSEMDTCGALSPKQRSEIKAYAWDFVSDAELDKVKTADGYLYVLGVWRYSLPGSSTIYVQKYCRYAIGSFDNWNSCGATYDDATVHIVK